MSQPPTLWGLSVSPWTEKARWALDHHRVRYHYREHTPLLGEPALRWRARGRAPDTRATVPLLIAGSEGIGDSLAIGMYAEERGSGPSLFPAQQRDAIDAWQRDAEAAMQAARVLVVQALLHNPAAQIEMLPPAIPGPLRRPLQALSRAGASFLVRKYDAGPKRIAASLRAVTEFAERTRQQLDGREHLLGERFTWADISVAMIINGIAGGVPGRLTKLPANAQTWTRAELVEQFPDLIAWRDRLYAKHRPASARVR